MKTDAFVRNVRMTHSGRIVGDLWIKLLNHDGITMVASGDMKHLYDVCNRNNFNLINYTETMSNTLSLSHFKSWQCNTEQPSIS